MPPTSWPGADMSAPKRARPVTLSRPSGRSGRVPTWLYLRLTRTLLSSSGMTTFLPHLGSGVEHRVDDLVVAGAAAQIAGQPIANFGLVRVRVLLQQRLGGHQEPRRSEEHTSELQSLMRISYAV